MCRWKIRRFFFFFSFGWFQKKKKCSQNSRDAIKLNNFIMLNIVELTLSTKMNLFDYVLLLWFKKQQRKRKDTKFCFFFFRNLEIVFYEQNNSNWKWKWGIIISFNRVGIYLTYEWRRPYPFHNPNNAQFAVICLLFSSIRVERPFERAIKQLLR